MHLKLDGPHIGIDGDSIKYNINNIDHYDILYSLGKENGTHPQDCRVKLLRHSSSQLDSV